MPQREAERVSSDARGHGAPGAVPLLSVRGLTVEVPIAGAHRPAVEGVSFDLDRGESLAIAGESGCGKTLLARALVALPPAGVRVSGEIRLDGRDLSTASARDWRRIRGGRIGFLFQEPSAAFDPVRTIGEHLLEAVRLHRRISRRAAREIALERLREVSFPDPVRGFSEYPHRLSGGQRQRALLAVALAADPDVLIADEPTTALDATVAAEVLELLARLRARRGLTLLTISHDLALVARETERVIVLYAGRVVEEGPTAEVFARPRHPYTRGLLASVPRLPGSAGTGTRLASIPGAVPDLADRVGGRCGFAPRCPDRFALCDREAPPLYAVDRVLARCFLYEAGGPAPAPPRRP